MKTTVPIWTNNFFTNQLGPFFSPGSFVLSKQNDYSGIQEVELSVNNVGISDLLSLIQR